MESRESYRSSFWLVPARAERWLPSSLYCCHQDTFTLKRRNVIQIAVQTDMAKYLVGTMFFGLTWCGPQQVKFGKDK
jgi:hypothetical protein